VGGVAGLNVVAEGFRYRTYPYVRSADQDRARPAHHPVVVAGGGLVGLTMAVDLAQRGVKVVVLDDGDQVSVGSRSICVTQRTLEIFDRLGIGARCRAKGVTWNTGKVFRGDRLLYAFDLQPDGGQRNPAFVNLQQYYVETYLIERLAALDPAALRWRNRVEDVWVGDDHVDVGVATPEGGYRVTCDWLIAADGVRSTVRGALRLPFPGEAFDDRFLITDIVMKGAFPPERWFWFDPPFHAGRSALLHKQPDNVWRIDLQLGPEARREEELREERIVPRLRAMLGPDVAFTIAWSSLYTFQCRRLDRFRHGRVIFVGDAAHTVSPFGARGGNGGVQDADNLGWKLAAVLAGRAPATLLDSYDHERGQAADENILNSTRATDFIAPKTPAMALFREAVLDLAAEHAFARAFVNSGRLSVASTYTDSPLSTADGALWSAGPAPGAPAPDAPVIIGGREAWLHDLMHDGPTVLCGAGVQGCDGRPSVRVVREGADFEDATGLVARRYALDAKYAYLVRPDGHVAARFRDPAPGAVASALERVYGRTAA
jgi:3-(3-hydroxy-phenyl)propionate hydroxylase